MKNDAKYLIVVVLLLGLICGGCSTIDSKPSADEKAKSVVAPTPGLKDCRTCQEAGNKMIPGIIDGLNKADYGLYSRDFSDKFKGIFTRDIFEKADKAAKDSIGDFSSYEYVGYWNKGEFTIMLWKARCTKSKDDVLIELYIKSSNGEYKVEGLKLI